MGNTDRPPKLGGHGQYDGYDRFIAVYEQMKGECPRGKYGVGLKYQRQGNRGNLLLRFRDPATGTRNPKNANLTCTPEGVVDGVRKARLISEALEKQQSPSEFWDWYKLFILEEKPREAVLTYRDIFSTLEERYYAGRNSNTGRPRSRDIPSDVSSYQSTKLLTFRCFSNWDTYPSWETIKEALYTPLKKGGQLVGSKTFADRYSVIKEIARECPNRNFLLKQLDGIDATQTIKRKKQRLSIDVFKEWWVEADRYAETIKHPIHYQARKSWLWVAAASVMYGLRPSEIAAALNLDRPFTTEDGMTIPALSDPDNRDCYLVLDDWMYPYRPDFPRVSVKTGERVIAPIPSWEMIELLKLKTPRLPVYTPKPNSKPQSIANGFNSAYTNRLLPMNCPITQKYAFRKLYNLLGERYGFPVELRARMMGHSTAVNESKYKTEGIDATLEVLKGTARMPRSYESAIEELKHLGLDTDSPEVKLILRVIYRLE